MTIGAPYRISVEFNVTVSPIEIIIVSPGAGTDPHDHVRGSSQSPFPRDTQVVAKVKKVVKLRAMVVSRLFMAEVFGLVYL